jgi:hypothetical protein
VRIRRTVVPVRADVRVAVRVEAVLVAVVVAEPVGAEDRDGAASGDEQSDRRRAVLDSRTRRARWAFPCHAAAGV